MLFVRQIILVSHINLCVFSISFFSKSVVHAFIDDFYTNIIKKIMKPASDNDSQGKIKMISEWDVIDKVIQQQQ